MKRIAAWALLALFAYSIYSLLTAPPFTVGGSATLPISSGLPSVYLPNAALNMYISSPLVDFILWLIYSAMALLAWIVYQLMSLIARLLGLAALPVPINATLHTGVPPTSTSPQIGGGGPASSPHAGPAPEAVVPIPVVLALVAVLAVALLVAARREAGRPSGGEAARGAAPVEAAASINRAVRPPGPSTPEVEVSMPPPVRPRLFKWPLVDDVPPLWPMGEPLEVEAAPDVEISASGCGESSGRGRLVLVSNRPCLAEIRARRGQEEERVLVKFADLHREVANSFYLAFKSAPPWATVREIMSSRGADPEAIEVVERAAYSELPMTYLDFVKFYRWLKGHGGV
ncbi:MAG: hypothetical protein QXP98_08795 [Thermoproteus sp.]